jgi:3-oxoacyl-[acyl-carrier-protein] synthase-3
MDGPGIFSFAINRVPPMIDQLLQAAGRTREDVDLFVFHQANAFMLEALRTTLAIPRERFVTEFAEAGNTVSSTIPIALHDHAMRKQLKAGTRAMLVGFGVGLSWGSTLAALPDHL